MVDVEDVLIVGGGAAGYTAGIFAARDRCRALRLLTAAQYLREGRRAV